MAAIKAILFDLDDTLWPIVPVISRAETLLQEWIHIHAPRAVTGYSIDEMRRRRLALMRAEPRYAIDLAALRHAVLTQHFHQCGEDGRLVEAAMAVFSAARNEVTPFPDVHPVLDRLRGRLLLGSISNGVADLETIGMAHYFKASVAAHRFGTAKPDPAIFHAGCEALGVAPEEAVYVGDDPLLDVEGAQKAGLRAVWLKRLEMLPSRNMPEHIRPDATCGSLIELEQWLDDSMMGPARTVLQD
ncbi:HAD family hydrolase [Noviherbaspirillum pedocola]|uniref:HAD family hydrolase n=1 Tax=Noviherbaspirillum pedocola TaxID=2801341 RepID=A0A934W7M6_9BURK|nr:HAD family hydrolase [Noviherbaspirillum pedocola]MBK4734859.1 HAD family hydrolase [Noviherbaspirillum pedocola]